MVEDIAGFVSSRIENLLLCIVEIMLRPEISIGYEVYPFDQSFGVLFLILGYFRQNSRRERRSYNNIQYPYR